MSEPAKRLLTVEEMLDECEAIGHDLQAQLGRFRAETRALDAWTDELTDRAFALEKLMDKLAVSHVKAAGQIRPATAAELQRGLPL